MLLHKRLIHQGTVFFRYRGQLPIIVILFSVFLIVFFPINLTKEFRYGFYALSSLFVISGHIIRASTVGNRHKHTSGRNRSHHYAENLNTTGWYSVTRNPLYFANFLIWLGLSLSTQHIGVVLLVCSFFWFVYQRIILSEEDYLLT
ncbi:MAG TPA: lipid A phosphate methyltransferase, partial [Crocinitomicaceae bacterium]|nr:lipid A phosphate methyltransferase [Crocinitomicaceae bacterium]